VRFDRRLVRTDAHGRAGVTAALTARGRRAVRAGGPGLVKDSAWVRVSSGP
jgi:hypothetical protein